MSLLASSSDYHIHIYEGERAHTARRARRPPAAGCRAVNSPVCPKGKAIWEGRLSRTAVGASWRRAGRRRARTPHATRRASRAAHRPLHVAHADRLRICPHPCASNLALWPKLRRVVGDSDLVTDHTLPGAPWRQHQPPPVPACVRVGRPGRPGRGALKTSAPGRGAGRCRNKKRCAAYRHASV